MKPKKPRKRKIKLPKEETSWKKGIDKWADEILDKWEQGDLRGKKMRGNEEVLPEGKDREYHLLTDGKTHCGASFQTSSVGDEKLQLELQKFGHPCPGCVKAMIKNDSPIPPKDQDFDLDSPSQRGE